MYTTPSPPGQAAKTGKLTADFGEDVVYAVRDTGRGSPIALTLKTEL